MKAYEIITNQIIEKLEAGVVPWERPWFTQRPANLISKKEYRGINVLLTAMQGYQSPFWLTANQAIKLGGAIKKGEKATRICFWKWPTSETKKDDTDDDSKPDLNAVPMLRYYCVFNVEQCELPQKVIDSIPKPPSIEFNPIDKADNIIENMPNRPDIVHKEPSAYYSPTRDYINLPLKTSFRSVGLYYSTAFHELVHSTGHPGRLNRKGSEIVNFGSESYAREELIAELGSSYLCFDCGIKKEIDDLASYIAGWLKALKNDKRMILTAGQQADKAVAYITGQTQKTLTQGVSYGN